MKPSDGQRQWRTIQVPSNVFRDRLNKALSLADTISTDKRTSVYSRLALIHQVAKQYAAEAVRDVADSTPSVDIEELTDPPLYDEETEECVIIQFSYTVKIAVSVT